MSACKLVASAIYSVCNMRCHPHPTEGQCHLQHAVDVTLSSIQSVGSSMKLHRKPPLKFASASAARAAKRSASTVRATLKRCCLARAVIAASAVSANGLSTADCRRRTSACSACALQLVCIGPPADK